MDTQDRSTGKEHAARRGGDHVSYGHAGSAMNMEDVTTNPLPAIAREPFLVLIDAQQARRAWVARLLTFAHYQVYVPNTPGEALTWFKLHRIPPQAILLGDLNPLDQVLIQRLFERVVVQNGRQIPVISLANFPRNRSIGDLPGCADLLEVLWLEVPRLKSWPL